MVGINASGSCPFSVEKGGRSSDCPRYQTLLKKPLNWCSLSHWTARTCPWSSCTAEGRCHRRDTQPPTLGPGCTDLLLASPSPKISGADDPRSLFPFAGWECAAVSEQVRKCFRAVKKHFRAVVVSFKWLKEQVMSWVAEKVSFF